MGAWMIGGLAVLGVAMVSTGGLVAGVVVALGLGGLVALWAFMRPLVSKLPLFVAFLNERSRIVRHFVSHWAESARKLEK